MENPDELRLSVSKTKCFSQCKKQFEFSYILKLPKKDEDYHIFGKFCHKALEDFHQAYINGSTDPFNLQMGRAFKSAVVEFKDVLTKEMKKECFDLINKYLKIISKDKDNHLSIPVLAVEKTFRFNISDNVVLNGMIDRVQIDPDGVLHVGDYKTTKNKKYLKNDWFQLLTYAYIMYMEDPTLTKVRGSYILLRHDFECITTEFDLKDILSIKDKYLDYADKMNSEKEYPTTPTALCGWCPYLEHCPDGQEKAEQFNAKRNALPIYGEVKW